MIVCIRIPDEGDSANFIKFVASQIEQGFTSGHIDAEHYWSIEQDS